MKSPQEWALELAAGAAPTQMLAPEGWAKRLYDEYARHDMQQMSDEEWSRITSAVVRDIQIEASGGPGGAATIIAKVADIQADALCEVEEGASALRVDRLFTASEMDAANSIDGWAETVANAVARVFYVSLVDQMLNWKNGNGPPAAPRMTMLDIMHAHAGGIDKLVVDSGLSRATLYRIATAAHASRPDANLVHLAERLGVEAEALKADWDEIKATQDRGGEASA